MDRIIKLMKDSDFDQALKEVEELLVADSYNLGYLSLKAQILTKTQKFAEAIEVHNRLLNLLPDNAEFYSERGLTFHHMGENQFCLQDFSKAIALEPENGYRYASRAYIKDQMGDHLGALADYTKAIELDPEDAVSLNNRGLVEEKLGRMHLAQESFAEADKAAGIDLEEILASQPIPEPSSATQPLTEVTKGDNVRVGFKYYLQTIKSLFISSEERKRFFDFLFKRQ